MAKRKPEPCEGYRTVIKIMAHDNVALQDFNADLAQKVRCARSWFDQLAEGSYGPEVAAFAKIVRGSLFVAPAQGENDG